jgi:hypothetical protein
LLGLGLSTSLLVACGWGDYTPTDNVLPEQSAEDDSGSDGPPVETGETGDPQPDFPATYRFDCIDIQMLGDADDSVFQVATLQNTWAADVANFKLNILIDLLEEDPDAGTGTVTVRSGVGAGWNDQCGQSDTESVEFPVGYEPGVSYWAPSDAEGQCAEPADAGGAGSYTLDLGANDTLYIYAEDDDGTAFNCSLDANRPDAIPISGVKATITGSADRSVIAGTLTGCMAEADALATCSCLAVCAGDVHPDCTGCPGGAVPLGLLLGGVNATPTCTDLLGETAFDIELQFSARRLGGVPTTCG